MMLNYSKKPYSKFITGARSIFFIDFTPVAIATGVDISVNLNLKDLRTIDFITPAEFLPKYISVDMSVSLLRVPELPPHIYSLIPSISSLDTSHISVSVLLNLLPYVNAFIFDKITGKTELIIKNLRLESFSYSTRTRSFNLYNAKLKGMITASSISSFM